MLYCSTYGGMRVPPRAQGPLTSHGSTRLGQTKAECKNVERERISLPSGATLPAQGLSGSLPK